MSDDHNSQPILLAKWAEARTLYGQGKTTRQIAHALDLPVAEMTRRALVEHWPAPPPPDWSAIRDAWEAGKPMTALAAHFGVSAATLRKRRVREDWQRSHARGIDALRLAVRTLEDTLDRIDPADTVATTRLAAALSMAAGRLRDAEKQILEKPRQRTDLDEALGLDGEDEMFREQMTQMLMRLAGGEETDAAPV